MLARPPRPIITTSVTLSGCTAAQRPLERLAVWPATTRKAGREAAVRHRDAGQLRRRDRGGHARHDLERNPGRRQRQRFFAAAAEHERVAALEPDDALALPRGADHQPVDRLLLDAGAARALADAETLRAASARAGPSASTSAS